MLSALRSDLFATNTINMISSPSPYHSPAYLSDSYRIGDELLCSSYSCYLYYRPPSLCLRPPSLPSLSHIPSLPHESSNSMYPQCVLFSNYNVSSIESQTQLQRVRREMHAMREIRGYALYINIHAYTYIYTYTYQHTHSRVRGRNRQSTSQRRMHTYTEQLIKFNQYTYMRYMYKSNIRCTLILV
jgi:hypothetical protein